MDKNGKLNISLQDLLFGTITIVILCITAFYFWHVNTNNKTLKDKIKISHNSGFYDNEFYLTIKGNPKYKIYYTTDCEKPTIESNLYTEPIFIHDASKNKNLYSSRNDLTIDYMLQSGELKPQEKFAYNKFIQIPDFKVNKAVTLRVAQYDKDGSFINEESRIYFIGYDKKQGYGKLPIISVVLEPYDLVDYEKGLFVLGKSFIKNPKAPIHNKIAYGGNFYNKGPKWERNCQLDIFDTSMNHIFSKKTKFKLQGKSGRASVKKNITLFSEIKKTPKYFFDIKLLGERFKNNKLILKGSDGYHKEHLTHSFCKKANMNIETTKMVPCILFLNGEYWGVYYIVEDIDKDYIKTKYGIKKSNINIYENQIKEIDIDRKTKHIDFEKAYKDMLKNVNIDSLIDYYATEIYVGNQDWLPNNYNYWKTNNKGSKIRYILWDVSGSQCLYLYKHDTIKHAIQKSPVFAILIKNKNFREKFKKRIKYLEEHVYNTENFNRYEKEYYSLLNEALYKDCHRFYKYNDCETRIRNYMLNIREFIKQRPQYLNKYIEEALKDE